MTVCLMTYHEPPISSALARRRIPGGYVIRDANGQALVYLYSRDDESEASQAKVLTKDEARRIAVNVAQLRFHAPRGVSSILSSYPSKSGLYTRSDHGIWLCLAPNET
jgi:hypothetical protein